MSEMTEMQQGMPAERWPKVAIIILNWNGWRDTIGCLESVEKLIYPNYEVILVDNGSADDSVAQICNWVRARPEHWGEVRKPVSVVQASVGPGVTIALRTEKLTLIRSDENLGFAGGCNLGARWAMEDSGVAYLYFLNNDARVTPSTITEVVLVARRLGADLVGSVIWEDPDNGPVFAGSDCVAELFWPTPMRVAFKRKARDVTTVVRASMVPGSGMLLSRKLVRERLAITGHLFNPLLYLYGEELDLCMWARNFGYISVIAVRSVVYHRETVHDLRKMARMNYYLARNLMVLAAIHMTTFSRYGFYLWHVLFRSVLALRWCIAGKPMVAMSILRGLRDGIRLVAIMPSVRGALCR